MKITDIYIQRPVLATVVSLAILVFGLRSAFDLPVRQFPFTENAVVTVTTVYYGADPALVAGFITTPLENSIAQANGIDYLNSISNQGVSTIQAYLRLNYDPNKAVSEINTKVNAVLNLLPKEAQQPSITVAIGETIDSMYMGFYSEVLPSNKITDYIIRVVQPKLQSITGVQQAEILGGRQFSLRAWLDPIKMSAYSITAADVSLALANNNFISAAGRTDGEMITVNLKATTDAQSVDEFRQLIVKSNGNSIVRLSDVATVSLGAEDYNTSVRFDGRESVYIGIKVAPTANLLTVTEAIREAFPDIAAQLPEGLNGKIVYDATKYVNSSIKEVEHSIIEALLIVTAVIFIFLGTFRSVIIPVIAMPLSLIGTFFVMLMLGYSINLLTLLALVLAIGLVVDDAIIVVENVYRHMEEGMPRFEAAILGARELANPIIAISVVLIAVYIPIGFMGGLTGALFIEFAFTLAGAVGVSAIIALTLSPMMCSKLLQVSHNSNHSYSGRFVHYVDRHFNRLRTNYEKALNFLLNNLPTMIVFASIILISIYFLYTTSKSELAPQEDQGIVITLATAAPNATLGQSELFGNQINELFQGYKELDHTFQLFGVSGLNTSINGMVLKPWDERKITTNMIQPELQAKFARDIAGANVVAFQPPSLPGSSGLPIQFVINTTEAFDKLNDVSQTLLNEARASGNFIFIDTDLKIDKQQTLIALNRDKATLLGLTMKDIGDVLASNLAANYVNFFNFSGRSYKVIPQVKRMDRINFDQLLNYYITAKDGTSVPISTVASIKTQVVPETLNHFQQLNSATLSGVAFHHRACVSISRTSVLP